MSANAISTPTHAYHARSRFIFVFVKLVYRPALRKYHSQSTGLEVTLGLQYLSRNESSTETESQWIKELLKCLSSKSDEP